MRSLEQEVEDFIDGLLDLEHTPKDILSALKLGIENLKDDTDENEDDGEERA